MRFHALIGKLGSADEALAALPAIKRGKSDPPPSAETCQAELDRIADLGAEVLFHGEEGYPELLATLPDAPALLYALGDLNLLARPALAMVGARTASSNGFRFARTLAKNLGEQGFVITSGLARGIDRAAHEGALATGTIAVIAGGFDHPYPKDNHDLHQLIAENGLILTEMPPDEKPTARHFPRRNRIVSGLSQGVVVVEAAARSGSLITARLAAEQGREVMAVPGAPYDPRTRGSNQLIKDGATLVENADDVLEALGPFDLKVPSKRTIKLTEPTERPKQVTASTSGDDDLIALIGLGPTPVDDLIQQTGIAPDQMQSLLVDLELSGQIERLPGDQVARISG